MQDTEKQGAAVAGPPAAENPLGKESVGRLMWKFSIPAIISMLVNAIYNTVDQVFIGQGIGVLGIAATNVAFPLATITTAIALLFGIGGAANFNLKQGAKDQEGASNIMGNAITMLVVSGAVLCAVVLVFLEPLLAILGATENIMPYATAYTAIYALGLPFAVLSVGAGHLIRADGSPTYAMVCMLAGAIFNVIFDPIFLFTFNMGIEGIALATTLGYILSGGIGGVYLLRKFKSVSLKKHHFKPRSRDIKAICALGMSPCFNQTAMTVVQITLNNTLRHYGALSAYGSDIPIAVSGVVSKINMLFMGFPIGIAQGCQPIFSFNYGAKQYHRVKQAFRNAIVAILIISAVVWVCCQLFPRQLISIFGQGSEEYFRFATLFMRVFMSMCIINGLQPLAANFFTSIGKAKLGVFVSLTRQIIFLLPLILILPLFWGIDGVVYASPIADMAAAVLAVFFIVRQMREMTLLQAGQQALQQEAAHE